MANRGSQTGGNRGHRAAPCGGASCGEIPILLEVQPSPFDEEIVCRLKFADLTKRRQRRRNVAERQIAIDTVRTRFARDTRIVRLCANIGREDHSVSMEYREIEAADADVIAREDEPPIRAVPDGARERAS